MDINREISQAVNTGRVILGSNQSVKAIKLGQVKLVILASNCPDTVRADVEHYAKLANIPVHDYEGDSSALALACGKPFLVGVVAILEPGSSGILSIRGSG